jgi:hypothetical protein
VCACWGCMHASACEHECIELQSEDNPPQHTSGQWPGVSMDFYFAHVASRAPTWLHSQNRVERSMRWGTRAIRMVLTDWICRCTDLFPTLQSTKLIVFAEVA